MNASTFSETDLTTRLVVGMEIHVELATRSKMFTSAPNVAHPDFHDAPPNTLCDPVVLGMPGVLPVINKRAVEMSILVGLALGCRIANVTKWDRKSYYYPDLPKNYQISQYDQPLCVDGRIEISIGEDLDSPTKTVRIRRAHLEEDAGKLLHEAPGGLAIDYSIVDLNRAGTPLLEVVTEPDLASAQEAVTFGQTLRDICRFLGVSEGIMQKGHMRFEPNINVVIEHQGKTYKTPIVEIKNLNSFKALYAAIEFEHHRQVQQWLEDGRVMGPGAKATRGWDDVHLVTTPQREKEDAHEYRYFPDPDLVPLVVSKEWVSTLKADLPELPLQRHRRYVHQLGLHTKDAQALIEEREVCFFLENVLAEGVDPKRAAAILLNSGAKRANEQGCLISELGITPSQIKSIVDLTANDEISSTAADQLFGYCCEPKYRDQDPRKIAQEQGLIQVSDTSALEGFIDQAIADPKNAKVVADIKAGKDKAIGALLGQVMKLSKGRANPKLVTDLVKQKIGS